MKAFLPALACAVAISLHAQLPGTSPNAAGFDSARLEVLHTTTKRFVDEGKHAGIITLLARGGRIVDFRTYGYRDVEKRLPMERDTICRVYSMSNRQVAAQASAGRRLYLWRQPGRAWRTS